MTGATWPTFRDDVVGALNAGLFEQIGRRTWSAQQIHQTQSQGLQTLLSYAIEHSPFHRDRLSGIDVTDLDPSDLSRLPIMTKAEMMEELDEVFTDRRLHRHDVESALAATRDRPVPILGDLVALATGGMELGSMSAMFFGFRERELVLSIFETITGLRMNHAYIRPGGLAADLPDEALPQLRELLKLLPKRLRDMENLLNENYIWKARTQGVGYLDLTGCMALGITGPVLRSTGLAHDLRKSQPYCGYESYDFDVITDDQCDAYGRYMIRVREMRESIKIVEQCVDRLGKAGPGPVMITDKKLAWPADLKVGPDGLGNSKEHIAKIMGSSMEALIHHFKLVTEGIRVPAGQVYVAVESPRGELGVHMVSDGGTRPYRVHYRDPSFTNLQAVSVMCEGSMVADAIAAVASIDPVMGGVDR